MPQRAVYLPDCRDELDMCPYCINGCGLGYVVIPDIIEENTRMAFKVPYMTGKMCNTHIMKSFICINYYKAFLDRSRKSIAGSEIP